MVILILILLLIEESIQFSGGETKDSERDEEFVKLCVKQKCIVKCCGRNGYINPGHGCVRNMGNETDGFRDVPLYDSNVRITDKNASIFNFVTRKQMNFSIASALYFGNEFNYYLTVNGVLLTELPNAYDRWASFENNEFCLDYALTTEDDIVKLKPRFLAVYNEPSTRNPMTFTFAIYAQLISCVFLVLLLVVYGLLPKLHNLAGKMLMTYVAALLAAFLLLSTLQLIVLNQQNTLEICLGLSYVIYFALLASFSWMTIITYDFWSNVRSFRWNNREITYSTYIYVWLVPVILTVGLAIMNSVDLKHVPWIITPRIDKDRCFLDGGEKFVYLYCPMLIMLVANCLMFISTCYIIFKVRYHQYKFSPPKSNYERIGNIIICLKLSVVMGISWILEIVGFFFPNLTVWYISDAYNLLTGVVLFVILICKETTLNDIYQRVRYGLQSVNAEDKQDEMELRERPNEEIGASV